MTLPRNAVAGGLGAASFVAVTQILTVEDPDFFLNSAVGVFAICIPMFARIWFRIPKEDDGTDDEAQRKRVRDLMFVCFVDSFGFALIFFHFGWLQGSLFVVFVLISLRKMAPFSTIRRLLGEAIRVQFQRPAEASEKQQPERKKTNDES